MRTQSFLSVPLEGMPDGDFEAPGAIYQLFIMKNVLESWESLSEDTRTRAMGAVIESMERNGGRLLLGCDVGWSNGEHSSLGVIAWPSAEAVQGHIKDLTKIGWHRYAYARTILGTSTM